MVDQDSRNYTRIAHAIDYIKAHFRDQPSLDELADAVHLSRYHFQRLFSDWAGVSPKKFVQFLSVEYAKRLLQQPDISLLDAAHETGLSGTSRLHDLFINVEGMTPGEFKNGGENLVINYSFAQSPFGQLIIATTPKGVCHLFFEDDRERGQMDLMARFPNAEYRQVVDPMQQQALHVFAKDWQQPDGVRLHLNGSPFQLKVWQALLGIPLGSLASYRMIAENIQQPMAARAVGAAIGSNPVAFLIPCHRVIQSSGQPGGYRWGRTRKQAMIGWEAAHCGR